MATEINSSLTETATDGLSDVAEANVERAIDIANTAQQFESYGRHSIDALSNEQLMELEILPPEEFNALPEPVKAHIRAVKKEIQDDLAEHTQETLQAAQKAQEEIDEDLEAYLEAMEQQQQEEEEAAEYAEYLEELDAWYEENYEDDWSESDNNRNDEYLACLMDWAENDDYLINYDFGYFADTGWDGHDEGQHQSIMQAPVIQPGAIETGQAQDAAPPVTENAPSSAKLELTTNISVADATAFAVDPKAAQMSHAPEVAAVSPVENISAAGAAKKIVSDKLGLFAEVATLNDAGNIANTISGGKDIGEVAMQAAEIAMKPNHSQFSILAAMGSTALDISDGNLMKLNHNAPNASGPTVSQSGPAVT